MVNNQMEIISLASVSRLLGEHNGVCALSPFVTLWTVACKAPLSMGFFREEYWSRLPCPSPGDPNSGIKPASPALQVDSLPTEPPGKPRNGSKNLSSLLCPRNVMRRTGSLYERASVSVRKASSSYKTMEICTEALHGDRL